MKKFRLLNREIRVGIIRDYPKTLCTLGVLLRKLKHGDGFLVHFYLFRFILYLDVIGPLGVSV